MPSQIKYMCKDGNQLTNVLPIMIAAHKKMDKYGSVAADADTDERTVKNMLMKMLNKLNGGREQSAQLVALNVLGADSYFCSDPFKSFNGQAATQRVIGRHEKLPAHLVVQPVPPLGVPEASDSALNPTDDPLRDHGQPAPSLQRTTLDLDSNRDDDGMDDMDMFTDEGIKHYLNVGADGKINLHHIILSYEHRSDELKEYSLYEFLAAVELGKKKMTLSASTAGQTSDDEDEGDQAASEEDDDRDEDGDGDVGERPRRKKSSAGRKKNFASPLTVGHPLKSTHEHRLLSKQKVPISYGRTPRLPSQDDRSEAANKARNAFAAYVITLYHPWSTDHKAPLIPLTYESLRCWSLQLSVSNSLIDRQRLRWIQFLASAFVVSSDDVVTSAAFRGRATTMWTQEELQQYSSNNTKTKPGAPSEIQITLEELALKYADQLKLKPTHEDACAVVASAEAIICPQGMSNLPIRAQPVGSDAANPNNTISTTLTMGQINSALAWAVSELSVAEDVQNPPQNPPATSGNGVIKSKYEKMCDLIESKRPEYLSMLPQLEALDKLHVWATGMKNFREGRPGLERPILHLFIHGAAGTGKSWFLSKVQDIFTAAGHPHGLVCTSFTGCASQQLPDGSTIHHALGLKVNSPNDSMPASASNGKVKNEEMDVLVIDEASMVTRKMLCDIDIGLRQNFSPNLPFGGRVVILLGDFFQIPAVSRPTLIDQMTADEIATGRRGLMTPNLFEKFVTIEFSKQYRAAADPEHMKKLEFFRNPQVTLQPIRESNILRDAKVLTTAESLGEWSSAAYVFADNSTRHKMNFLMTMIYAKRTGQPVISVRLPLNEVGQAYVQLRENRGEGKKVRSENPEIYLHFVKGAPVMIDENVNVRRGIFNGAEGKMHSIRWMESDVDNARAWENIQNDLVPGEIFDLPFVPFAINILMKLKPEAKAGPSLAAATAACIAARVCGSASPSVPVTTSRADCGV